MSKTHESTIPKRKASSAPLAARVGYLYQAAAYLHTHAKRPTENVVGVDGDAENIESQSQKRAGTGHSRTRSGSRRYLLAHMRAISLKGQLRLSSDLKRTVCRRCDELLVPGESSTVSIENESKARKSHADVKVETCMYCGGKKRFPLARKQKRTSQDLPGASGTGTSHLSEAQTEDSSAQAPKAAEATDQLSEPSKGMIA